MISRVRQYKPLGSQFLPERLGPSCTGVVPFSFPFGAFARLQAPDCASPRGVH
jgi:hypothetical protein